jgi:hypothetical protein
MVHPRYDLEAWTRDYPLASRKELVSHRGWRDALPVFSPDAIALNEQIRREIWPDLHRHEHLPCDLFCWGCGEPALPEATKIGGLPFLDRSMPWPHDDQDRPMGFVCQINFQDSLDLCGELPGDVLLFFSKVSVSDPEHVYLAFDQSPTTHALRWVRVAEVSEPLREVPGSGLDLWPLHGVIHRSFDVPTLDYWFRSELGETLDRDPLYNEAFPPAIWWSTKIGGTPHWEQGVDLGLRPHKGVFLAQILSDRAILGVPDPYLLRPKRFPKDQPWPARSRRLRIGDMGSAYFFLVEGDIHLRWQW